MLTQDQIDFFHTNGFLIMRSIIRGRELQMLQKAADRVIEEGNARIGPQDHRYAVGPDGREVYWRSERMWERDQIFRAVTVNPDILENIGQCVGQTFYPWNDSLVVKVPYSGAAVKWHQDPPYRNPDRETVYPVPNFTTDIYLDHSGPENGCVYAIPGHHLVGHIELSKFSEEELFAKGVPLELEPGDVLFHCLSTPHGSRANTSGSIRRIFYIHYLSEDVFQDGYSAEAWAKEKPGWSRLRFQQTENMISERAAYEFEMPLSRKTLQLTQEGILFTGDPSTTPQYWDERVAAMPAERRRAIQRLEDRSPTLA